MGRSKSGEHWNTAIAVQLLYHDVTVSENGERTTINKKILCCQPLGWYLRKKESLWARTGHTLAIDCDTLEKNHDRTEENGNNLEKEMWIVLAEELLLKPFNVGDEINEANDDN
jgi:hypothetical protein